MEERLLAYLYYFNVRQDYFECHEYGESLWLDTGRPLVLKGLIQAAVCLYHLHNGNVRGGYAMWARARTYLSPSRPVYECINVDALIADLDRVFAQVPADWRDRVLDPRDIAALHLPTVYVRITDAAVEEQLQAFTPTPLA